MLGLVLQGGGAKGAFQAGAIKALTEEGIIFDGVTGTSIGAINGAMVVQGSIEELCELWNDIKMDMLFSIKDEEVEDMMTNSRAYTVRSVFDACKKIISDRGLDVSKAIDFVAKHLDEDKIRNSRIDYGLVTVDFADKIAKELFKGQIEKGKLLSYIVASANFPLFKRQYIDDKAYFDGGLYNNLPINMLINKGYDDIIAIRLGSSLAPVKKFYDRDVKITYIDPSEKPGTVLNFSPESIRKALVMGYLDTKKIYKNYAGKMYYIIREDTQYAIKLLLNLDETTISGLSQLLNLDGTGERLTFIFKLFDELNIMLDLNKECCPFDTLVSVVEYLAEEYKVERLKLYNLQDFCSITALKLIQNGHVESKMKSFFMRTAKKYDVCKLIFDDIINKV